MRRALLWLFAFIFGVSASIATLLVLLFVCFNQPKIFKDSLNKSGIYPALTKFVNDQLEAQAKAQPGLYPFVNTAKAEFTPQYLNNKFDQLADDFYKYTQGRTETLQSTDLNDLKKTLLRRNANFASLISQLSNIFDQEVGITLEQGTALRQYYSQAKQLTLLSLALSLVSLAAMFFLASPLSERIRVVGRELAKIGIPGFLSTLVGLAILYKGRIPDMSLPENIAFLKEPIAIFAIELTKQILIYSLPIFGVLTATGALFLLIARSMRKKDMAKFEKKLIQQAAAAGTVRKP